MTLYVNYIGVTILKIILKRQEISVGEEVEKKGTLIHYWWGGKLVPSLWITVGRLIKNLKTELQYDPAIPLLGICPKKMQTLI